MYECILPGSIRYDTGLTICNTIRHKAREISSVQRKPQHGQYYESTGRGFLATVSTLSECLKTEVCV